MTQASCRCGSQVVYVHRFFLNITALITLTHAHFQSTDGIFIRSSVENC